jgi:hypothetical protein
MNCTRTGRVCKINCVNPGHAAGPWVGSLPGLVATSNLISFSLETKWRASERSCSPVGKRHCPFLFDVTMGQINQLQQGHIGSEAAFCLSDFPDLAVKPFDGIGRVDQLSDSRVVSEIGGQF